MSARAIAAALAAIAAAAGLGAMPAPAGAGWRLDRPLESGPYGGFNQGDGVLAADRQGRLAAAWIAGVQRVHAALGTTRTGLNGRFSLSPARTPVDPRIRRPFPAPEVAFDGSGRAAFAWGGSPAAIWLIDLGSRSGPRMLFPGSDSATVDPDGTGGLRAAWGTPAGVVMARAPAGGPFGTPAKFQISAGASTTGSAPGRAGGLLVGLERRSRPRVALSVQELAPDGTPGPEQQLAAGRTVPDPDYPDEPDQDFQEVWNLQLAGNAAGDAVACWNRYVVPDDARTVRAVCARRAPGGRFGRPVVLAVHGVLEVAMTEGGEALVLLPAEVRGKGALALHRAARGRGFGAPAVLLDGSAGELGETGLSVNARGDALLVGRTGNGDAKAVVASVRRAGGRFGAWLPVGFGEAAAGAIDGAGRAAILVSHAGPQPSRPDGLTEVVGTETRLARLAAGYRPPPEVQITDLGRNNGATFSGVFRERRYGFGVRLSTLRPCRLRVVWSVDRVNGRRLGLGGAAVLGARTVDSSGLLGGGREVWVGVQGARTRARIQRRVRGRLSLRWVRVRVTVTATAPGSPQAADSAATTVHRNPGDRS